MPTLSSSDASLIEALSSKKTAIQKQIISLKSEIKQLSGGMNHIDATIALIRGETGAPTKRGNYRHFKPNECKTAILDMLRTAAAPLDTKSISVAVAERSEIAIEPDDFRYFQKSIAATLGRLESRGLIRTTGKEGLMKLWAIAR